MCRLEKYGNCDEETKEQEYCIFHKPNKSEEEAREFYEKFLDKFNPKKEKIWDELSRQEIERLVFQEVDCRGYVFPEIPMDSKFSLEYAIFERDARFDGAEFEGDAWFRWVTFKGDAWFRWATFKRKAVFIGATFEGNAGFNTAIFEDYAGFRWAIFKGHAWFNDEAIFEGNAEFTRVTFEGDAGFNEAIFERNAWFRWATFKGDAGFNDATFYGRTGFIEATFEDYTEFTGATFEEIVDFWGKKEGYDYKFYSKLVFLNTEFRKGVYIDIPSEWFKLPEAEAEACRVQRISYEKEGKKDDADRMFVRERRALRRAEIEEAKANVREVKEELKRLVASSPQKVERVKAELKAWFDLIKATSKYLLAKGKSSLEFLLADLTCEYGTNWKRPVISWIFLVFFIFPLLYFILGGITKVSSLLDYLYFSIVTATTLGYGDLQPIGWCRLIASTEAIFGTFMWAVFLVVFARKYMR